MSKHQEQKNDSTSLRKKKAMNFHGNDNTRKYDWIVTFHTDWKEIVKVNSENVRLKSEMCENVVKTTRVLLGS